MRIINKQEEINNSKVKVEFTGKNITPYGGTGQRPVPPIHADNHIFILHGAPCKRAWGIAYTKRWNVEPLTMDQAIACAKDEKLNVSKHLLFCVKIKMSHK